MNCPRLADLLSKLAALIDASIVTWGEVNFFINSFHSPPDGITVVTDGELRDAAGLFWGACNRRFGHRAYQIGNALIDRLRAGILTADDLDPFIATHWHLLCTDRTYSAQL